MKELIDRFGLNELLAYLCPGLFLLASVPMWIKPSFGALVGDKLAESPAVIAPVLLILAYATGLLVAAWAGHGANTYARRAAGRKHRLPSARWWTRFGGRLPWCYLWGVHSMPLPRFNPSIVRAHLKVSILLAEYSGLQGLTGMESPWDRLAIFRAVVSGRVSPQGVPILAEAETVHRRLLFALSMALVSLIVAFEALVRLVAAHTWLSARLPLPPMPAGLVWTLLIGGVAASAGLRWVAGRWWQHELLLTCSLCH